MGCKMPAAARSVQRGGRDRIGLRLLEHLQRGIERVAQIGGGARTAAQPSRREELHVGGAVRLRNENAGGELDLDGAVHGAVGRDNVEVDQRPFYS